MRIIGVDLGSICCGYGIVEAPSQGFRIPHPRYVTSGDIRMNKMAPLPERLKVLYLSLKDLVNEYKPEHLCLEKIFYNKSITSAFTLGSTRGIAMLVAAETGMKVFEYNPTKVKMAITGYGRAEKKQVKDIVKILLNLDTTGLRLSEDKADALALCICHINSTLQQRGSI